MNRSMGNIKKIHSKCCFSNNSGNFSNNKEYDSIHPGRYYTLNEEVILRFYQTPKALLKNPRYEGLSLGPKLMYSILRDRLDLSIQNNWKDKKGYIYLIFGIEELASLLELDYGYKEKLYTFKDMPGEICQQCNEKYLTAEAAKEIEYRIKKKIDNII